MGAIIAVIVDAAKKAYKIRKKMDKWLDDKKDE